MGIRFTIITILVGIAYIFLIFNLYQVQISDNRIYLARAQSQYLAAGFLKAKRGVIYFTDKDGRHLAAATNKEFPIVYAVPWMLEDWIEAANRLALILNQPVEELEQKLSKESDPHELLAERVSPEVASQIKDLKIKGIFTDVESERFYPFGNLASQVLGFFGPSSDEAGDIGRYGLERFYNEELSGRPGIILNDKVLRPEPGQDFISTIDPNIQSQAKEILNELVENYNARGGTIIIQEPSSGKILALENNPSFNPNSYSEFEIPTFSNPALQGIYEPGSVFKIITMAAGIDSGKITPETTYIDRGSVIVSGKKIENWDQKVYGKITMTNVLEKSINTGAIFAEKEIGHAAFRDYLEKFGFDKETEIDLPAEIKGNLKRLKDSAPEVAFATASFGQGVAITPLELINAFSAIANGGKLMRPYLNAGLEPKVLKTVMKPESTRAVTEMMISAVDKAGVAKINSYTIAGKTGTAQIPDFEKGGYTDNVINTYVGFGPTSEPKFVILIKLDNPYGAPLAGLTVVPAFRELAQFILNYYEIPPDRL